MGTNNTDFESIAFRLQSWRQTTSANPP